MNYCNSLFSRALVLALCFRLLLYARELVLKQQGCLFLCVLKT